MLISVHRKTQIQMTAIRKNVCSIFIQIAMGHTTEESRSWVTAAFYVRKSTKIFQASIYSSVLFPKKKRDDKKVYL